MKTKMCMLLLVLGLGFMIPVQTYSSETNVYAQITDDDLDYQNSNMGEIGPVSLDPEFLKGVISYDDKTITNTFFFDFGTVTVWISDANGNLIISEEVNTSVDANSTIDIKDLRAGSYKIIVFLPEGQQVANFNVK